MNFNKLNTTLTLTGAGLSGILIVLYAFREDPLSVLVSSIVFVICLVQLMVRKTF
ncbi:MAG: hypothetical protein Fur0010_25560 [Bdellovibrio sp.]